MGAARRRAPATPFCRSARSGARGPARTTRVCPAGTAAIAAAVSAWRSRFVSAWSCTFPRTRTPATTTVSTVATRTAVPMVRRSRARSERTRYATALYPTPRTVRMSSGTPSFLRSWATCTSTVRVSPG